MNSDQERDLLNYIAEGREERTYVKEQLGSANAGIQRVYDRLMFHEREDKTMFEGLDRRMSALEDAQTSTGRHNIDELTKALEEKKNELKDRKAQELKVALWVLGAAVSWVLSLFAAHTYLK